jgi:hypothetical protein
MPIETIKDVHPAHLDRPLHILVTVHSMTKLSDVYKKGLGLWVNYILQKHLKNQNIPHQVFLKSIITEGKKKTSVDQVIHFIQKNNIDILVPTDVTDTQFVAEHHEELTRYVKFAVTDYPKTYETLENKWSTFQLCKNIGVPTPQTELIVPSQEHKKMEYPFFLKVGMSVLRLHVKCL